MEEADVLSSDTELELAESLDKWSTLDITNGSTQFNDADIGFFAGTISGLGCDPFSPFLDFICDVGYNLNGFPKVITTALSLDDAGIDLAGG